MHNRSAIHKAFVDRFCSGQLSSPIPNQELDAIEADLDTKLPCSYREFMVRHGAVFCPAVLDEITDRGLEFPDVQQFLEPKAAVEETKGDWTAGMPRDVIGIASDCMGNMIGFRRQSEPVDDAPVIFFDHDYVEVSQIADSFDAFLGFYLDHLKAESRRRPE